MIDIHAHILPQVDDGPRSWEETMQMLREGVKDGVKGVVCTSHIYDLLDTDLETELIQKFNILKARVKKERLPISLWLGSEIHCNAKLNQASPIFTLNGNRKYVLMELPLQEFPPNAAETFFKLSLQGFRPILAHPERNGTIVQKPTMAFELVNRGVYLQVNAGSLTGNFGKRIKRLAFELIDHNLVHFIASDCHSIKGRPLLLSVAYHKVKKSWGEDRAQKLFVINPQKAVHGDDIQIDLPRPLNEKKKNIFMNLFKVW